MAAFFPLQSSGEADQSPDQAIVAAMRLIAALQLELFIESMFHRAGNARPSHWKIDAETAQAWFADQHEQGKDGFFPVR